MAKAQLLKLDCPGCGHKQEILAMAETEETISGKLVRCGDCGYEDPELSDLLAAGEEEEKPEGGEGGNQE